MTPDPRLKDFRNFLYVIWKNLNLPEPTPRQYAIAEFLQHGPKRKMVQGFRGIGKSWVTCAYVCWRLYCNPQLNILVVSASKAKADEFCQFTKRLISDVPCLQHLKPRNKDQRWTAISFDVAPAEADPNPSVKSAGITGQVTGSRADEIIADDIETSDNALTQGMREKLAEKVKEFDAIIKPGEATRITWLGTPQTEGSVYNRLPERGYTIRTWPALYPTEKQRARYGDRLAPDIASELDERPDLAGTTTDPQRFTDMDLAQRKASWGASGFALQFMLDTTLADTDRFPLKLRDLVVTHLDHENGPEKCIWAASPEWVVNDVPCVGMDGDRYYRPVPMPGLAYREYTGSVLVVDPAGRGQDETSYCVVKTLNGFLFLLDAGGFPPGQGFADETLAGIAKLAARWKVNKILVESNFGDGMFIKLLTPHVGRTWPCGMEEVKHSTQKERRICDTLEPVIQSHRLIVNQSLIQKDHDSTAAYPAEAAFRYQLFYQLTRITRDKGALAHDDRLDALAIAVAFFAVALSADTDKRVEAARKVAMESELRRHLAHALGKPVRDSRMWSRPIQHR